MEERKLNYKISIYVIGDDEFIQGLEVLLFSLKCNDSYYCNYNIVCLYDNNISPFSKKNRVLIKKIIPELTFREINVKEYRYFPASRPKDRISLLKFELFNSINLESDYNIYLDSDMIVLKSIFPLILELDKSKLSICGVENRSRSKDFRIYSFESFPMNAGIFALKTSLIKQIFNYDEIIEEINNVPRDQKLLMLCQPILNYIFHKRDLSYLSAPRFFNFRELKETEKNINSISIIHYVTRTTNKSKPWDLRINQLQNDDNELSYRIWKTYKNKINEINSKQN